MNLKQQQLSTLISLHIKLIIDLCDGAVGKEPTWFIIRKSVLRGLNDIKQMAVQEIIEVHQAENKANENPVTLVSTSVSCSSNTAPSQLNQRGVTYAP